MLDPRLYQRLGKKKNQLDALRPLPAGVVARLRAQLNLDWIYNSNAIEGSTLTLRETDLVLNQGVTIGGKTLREHFEVTNHSDAIGYLETLIEGHDSVTPFQVRQIHNLVLARIDDDNAGRYRTGMVRIAGTPYEPPEAWQVPSRMRAWGDWLQGPAQALHSVVRAALAHHRLVVINPFLDGNGRTARLVMNLLLMRDGYPPTIIRRIHRAQYYRVLSHADNSREAALVNFVGRAVEHSLSIYLAALTARAKRPLAKQEWMRLRIAAEGTPYSQEYLSLLARLGRLQAMKRGRVWFTTRQAVEEYQRSLKAKR